MADFYRTHLKLLAEKNGHVKGVKASKAIKAKIEKDLKEYFKTPEGISVLRDAPRVHYTDRGQDKYRQMTADDAVSALLEEIDE